MCFIAFALRFHMHALTHTHPTHITVIEELHRFKSQHQIDASAFLDRNIKMVAFNFARQSNLPAFLKMMVNIFDLPIDKDMFIEKIRDILAEHNYKDVRINEAKIKNFHTKSTFFLTFAGLPNCT